MPTRVTHVPVRAEFDETKASLLTTEFWAFLAAVVGVLAATQMLDEMQAWDGWRLVSSAHSASASQPSTRLLTPRK